MIRFDHRYPTTVAQRPKALAKQTFSTVNCPSFSCSSLISASRAVSLRDTALENTSGRPSFAWRFHCAIMFGWTSGLAASSARVLSPTSASRATRALNSV